MPSARPSGAGDRGERNQQKPSYAFSFALSPVDLPSAPARGVRSERRRPASTARARAAGEALQLFLHGLLQDVAVEREVGDQPLEFAVFFTQLTELAQLTQAEPRVLLLPDVKGGVADPVLAADLAHPGAALATRARSAPRCGPSLAWGCPPQAGAEDHTSSRSLNLSVGYFAGFRSQVL